MEKNALKAIITARLKKMQKFGEEIKMHFRDEDIHKFRVEVKKLRAFLRLIALGIKNPKDLKLPKKLKEINTTAGAIRDIHLHLRRMETAIPENAAQPDSYFELLRVKEVKNKKS